MTMTNEEAIKWFRNSPVYHKDHEPYNKAIQALEKEPCPYWDYGLNTCRHANIGALATKPCEDAISREDALDILEDYDYDRDRHVENAFADARAKMCDLPPVTPIRPKGEWKYDHKIAYFQDRYVCSECGSERYFTRDTITNFCPNCGADMRGEEE